MKAKNPYTKVCGETCQEIRKNKRANFYIHTELSVKPCEDINSDLWERYLISKNEFPEKICRALIPPLCIMIKHFFELCGNGDKNEYNAIIQYLNEYHTNTTLEDLCSRFSRSKSYLSHMFKKTYGKNLSDYCNELKLKDAEKMLITTEKTVTDIAFDCGFRDVSYFINMFKRKKGTTPLQYRKNWQNRYL